MLWADIGERYHVSSARYQQMRWEEAGAADVSALEALREASAARVGDAAPAVGSDEPAALLAADTDTPQPSPVPSLQTPADDSDGIAAAFGPAANESPVPATS